MPVANHVCRVYNVAAILRLWYAAHAMLFLIINFVYFCISSFRSMRALLFSLGFWWHAFHQCCSMFWIILRWYCLPLLFVVSLLFLRSTFPIFLSKSLYILKYISPFSWSHLCLLKFQYLLPFVYFFITIIISYLF